MGSHLMEAVLLLLFVCGCNAASLRLNTTSINAPNWVELEFDGVPHADRAGCWIGVFSPPTDEVHKIAPLHSPATPPWTKKAPVKYIECTEADHHFETTGKGKKAFELVNSRENYQFWIFYGGVHTPNPIAKSAVITVNNVFAPIQGHISRTQKPTEMHVMWNSKNGVDSLVRWGTSPSALPHLVNATVKTYHASNLCGEPAKTQGWRNPGYFHTALLTGLPNTGPIYYQYGGPTHGWARVKLFYALPAAPSPSASLNISIVADMGVTERDGTKYHWAEHDAWQTIGHVTKLKHETDVVLHIGDVSYATGYAAKWDAFMASIEDVATMVPYMTSEGNHERDWPGTGSFYTGHDSGGECGVPMQHRFSTPASHKGGWYSFKQGPVHFVMMNTELPCGAGSPQLKWMSEDLAAVDRKVTPWIIFSGHRPMYDSAHHDAHFEHVEDLLYKHQVDLALWGHVHYATATCPVYRRECKKPSVAGGYDAPIHAVIGNGGQSLTPLPAKPQHWVKYQAKEWGYERILVHNATHLTMQFFHNTKNFMHHSFHIVRTRR